MQRRDLLKLAALTAGATAAQHALAGTLAPPDTPNTTVRRVLVVFKCHLDVGFTDTQAAVMRKYFDVYYPQAIDTGAVGFEVERHEIVLYGSCDACRPSKHFDQGHPKGHNRANKSIR